MLKPRNIFLILYISIFMVYLFLPWDKIFFIVLCLIFLSNLVYFSANICSQVYIKTLCKANTNNKSIAITFDDGPNSNITPELLKTLDLYNVKAAFFCVGKQIENNPELLKELNQKGHIVGNHTWSHDKWFDLFSSKKMKIEIEKTNNLIFEIINKKVKLFRPPYGVTNPNVKKAIKNYDFHTIGWSIRSLDTIYNTKKTLKRIKKNLSPGDIILFHDKHEHVIEILKLFFEYCEKEEYEIVRLDKLLNIEAYKN